MQMWKLLSKNWIFLFSKWTALKQSWHISEPRTYRNSRTRWNLHGSWLVNTGQICSRYNHNGFTTALMVGSRCYSYSEWCGHFCSSKWTTLRRSFRITIILETRNLKIIFQSISIKMQEAWSQLAAMMNDHL